MGRWCDSLDEDRADLLQRYCDETLDHEERNAVNTDLNYCTECVDDYHKARDGRRDLWQRLYKLEISRLLGRFSLASVEEDLCVIENGQEFHVAKSDADYASILRDPISEILKYPYLLSHPQLSEMCIEALDRMERIISFGGPVKYPGIYLLLVHPNEKARRWAISVAKSLGTVDRDDFYDLQEVFESIFLVVELGMSQCVADEDMAYNPADRMTTLPPHLYDGNEKNLWLGICVLLTQLDAQAMDSLFLGPGRTSVLQCIQSRLSSEDAKDSNSDPFWPALHCFMVILDRLGSRIWGGGISPRKAFIAITKNTSYIKEIENIRRETLVTKLKQEPVDDDDDDDDGHMVTCSQMVYSSNFHENRSRNARRGCHSAAEGVVYEEMSSLVNFLQSDLGQAVCVHNSTFLWLISFANALMDLDDTTPGHDVIVHLCYDVDRDLHDRRAYDRVTECFTLVLIHILKLHLARRRTHQLYFSSHSWVKVLVTCATLPESAFQGQDPPGPHAVSSSTSSSFLAPGGYPRPHPTAVPREAMSLVRSLLKEGKKLSPSGRCSHFLDLRNEHFRKNRENREGGVREWSLSRSEVLELNGVLSEVARLMMDIPASGSNAAATTSPAAASTSPAAGTSPLPDPRDTSGGAPSPSPRHLKSKTAGSSALTGDPPKATFPIKQEGMGHLVPKTEPDMTFFNDDPKPFVRSLKPDMEKLKAVRSKLGQFMLQGKSDTRGRADECPRDECGEGGETGSPRLESTNYDQQDDIPLSDLAKQLKSKASKSGQIQIKNGEVIVISDESDATDIDEEADPGKPAAPWGVRGDDNDDARAAVAADDGALQRDFDWDVSDSQVFEFETQDFVASAWLGPARPGSPSPEATGADASPVRSASDGSGSQTQAVSHEDIERACRRAEDELRESEASSFSSSGGGGDGFKRAPPLPKRDQPGEPRPSATKCRGGASLLEEAKEWVVEEEPYGALPRFSLPLPAGKERIPSKSGSVLVDSKQEIKPQSEIAAGSKTQSGRTAGSKTQSGRAAASKTQSGRAAASKTQSVRADGSKTQLGRAAGSKTQSGRAAESKAQSKGAGAEAGSFSPALSRAHLPRSTPAVVPPKKVRLAPEPSSTAERLGLKKKERKAFDLSQRSLDSVDELRRHGQAVHVEKEPGRARRRNPKKVPSVAVAGVGRSLAPQELQFLRQRKEKQLAAAQATRPRALSGLEKEPIEESKGKEEEDEEEEEIEDDDPLPASQPDPERVVSGSIREKTSGNKPETSEEKSDTSSHFHGGDDGGVTPAPSGGQSVECHRVDNEEEEEWMQHTQHSVIEMEMCSQLEEAYYSFTQTDPVDMDLSDSQQPAQPPNRTAEDRTGPAPPGSRGDHAFLKPVTPAEFKKAKALTTKVFATASSRSAALMQEMEKAPKAPGSAVGPVGRGRAARPATGLARNPGAAPHAGPPPAAPPPPPSASLLMPPPAPLPPPPAAPPAHRALKQHNGPGPGGKPLAGDAPRPPGARSVSFQPGTKEPARPVPPTPAAVQPPTHLTYARPEAPAGKPAAQVRPRSAGQDPPARLDQVDLIRDVLKWDYNALHQLSTSGPPQELCQLERVGVSFPSFEQYQRTFYPLLLLNAFEELASNWQKNTEFNTLTLTLIQHKYINGAWSVSFSTNLSGRDLQCQLYPKEEDVVVLWLPQNAGAYTWDHRSRADATACFGFVRKSIVSNRGAAAVEALLNLTIETRGNVTSIDRQAVRCELVGSLVSTLREFRALCTLRNSPMGRALLDDHLSLVTLPREESLRASATPAEYNADQQRAIRAAVSSVKTLQRNPKICLIHGPPGTGKSHTILGILKTLFSDGPLSHAPVVVNRQVAHRPIRALLCAPSNAAIDNLMKTVVLAFKKILGTGAPRGNCGDLNLVRLGSEKSITEKMKDFSLDRQTLRKTQKAPQLEQELLARMTQLDRDIETISTICINLPIGTSQHEELKQEKIRLLETRQKLSQELKDTRVRKQGIQTKILQQSHIVFCTLSTSGGNHLLRHLGHEPFSCVIVDEASQAKETETIIPLVFQCNSLVLVGDPEQLPPTVISQRAKEFNFGQSLMARMCKAMEQSCRSQGSPSPVVFLRVQYRMHPDICMFPSKHVYDNLLQTDPAAAERRCAISWPFQSYRLFDVTDGREVKEGDSYCNEKEVKLLTVLLKMITERECNEGREIREGMVGVITPYRAQRERIRKELARIDSRHKIVVDTVDGFQGREMECVVVSCVRASHEGGIGFLGNRERLNVTITRAKSSLFILGHLKTLRPDSEWAALIKDASRRGTIIRTEEKSFKNDARQIFKPESLSRSLSHTARVPGPQAQHSSAPVQRRRATVPPPTGSRVSLVAPMPRTGSAFQEGERPTDPRLEPRAGMQREPPSTSPVDSLGGQEGRRGPSPTRWDHNGERPSMSRPGARGHSRDQHRPSPPQGHARRKRGLEMDASPPHPTKRYNR